jgi:Na+/H+-translocating membrane pyrophosphatase
MSRPSTTDPRRNPPPWKQSRISPRSRRSRAGLAGYYYKKVKAASPGDERMVFLMTEIQKGARAFLKKEYQWVGVFAIVLAIVLAVVIAPLAAVSYLLGACCRQVPATRA